MAEFADLPRGCVGVSDGLTCLQSHNETFIVGAATELISHAARLGVVLTISQEPREPLAMGNYASVVSVRSRRQA